MNENILSVQLDPEIIKRLEKAADEQFRTKSAIMRLAVVAYLDWLDSQPVAAVVGIKFPKAEKKKK